MFTAELVGCWAEGGTYGRKGGTPGQTQCWVLTLQKYGTMFFNYIFIYCKSFKPASTLLSQQTTHHTASHASLAAAGPLTTAYNHQVTEINTVYVLVDKNCPCCPSTGQETTAQLIQPQHFPRGTSNSNSKEHSNDPSLASVLSKLLGQQGLLLSQLNPLDLQL